MESNTPQQQGIIAFFFHIKTDPNNIQLNLIANPGLNLIASQKNIELKILVKKYQKCKFKTPKSPSLLPVTFNFKS